TFFNSLRRYFASRSTGRVTDIGGGNGQAFYRDSTWYLALGRILYRIDPVLYRYRLSQPRISGLDSSYCGNQGIQKIKMLNLPDTATLVKVTLDNASLSLAPDSSFSFNVGDLAAGSHAIDIIYSNAADSQTLTDSFTVIAAVTPKVKLSSNISTVTNLVDPVIITAANIAGGGSKPLYTFAVDRGFASVLQPEGTANELSINPGTLVVGNNTVYVSMRTSDSCHTASIGLDSLQLVRYATTGIIDPDFPNQPISCFPNPFGQVITISGLQTNKSYRITIYDNLGEPLYQRELNNSNTLTIALNVLSEGIYWLSIFDNKKNKLIGTMILFKK
ncbi:MAG TPA: T9SS type A sorting domain-containing protein, partial [Puia sp.]|nr:T9SS type A sorting domain-containing protein [Puia sp.]